MLQLDWSIWWLQILALKSREPAESINLNKETEGSCSNRSENNSDIKLDISRTPAIDSPQSTHPNPTSRTLFSSSLIRPSSGVAQLFQNTSRPEVIQCQKIDQMVKEESLTNMFCGIDDQSAGFWPWLETHQFNWAEPTKVLNWAKPRLPCFYIEFLIKIFHVLVLRLNIKFNFQVGAGNLYGGINKGVCDMCLWTLIPCFLEVMGRKVCLTRLVKLNAIKNPREIELHLVASDWMLQLLALGWAMK